MNATAARFKGLGPAFWCIILFWLYKSIGTVASSTPPEGIIVGSGYAVVCLCFFMQCRWAYWISLWTTMLTLVTVIHGLRSSVGEGGILFQTLGTIAAFTSALVIAHFSTSLLALFGFRSFVTTRVTAVSLCVLITFQSWSRLHYPSFSKVLDASVIACVVLYTLVWVLLNPYRALVHSGNAPVQSQTHWPTLIAGILALSPALLVSIVGFFDMLQGQPSLAQENPQRFQFSSTVSAFVMGSAFCWIYYRLWISTRPVKQRLLLAASCPLLSAAAFLAWSL
jgi:flagellar biosynthesis protein FlhB